MNKVISFFICFWCLSLIAFDEPVSNFDSLISQKMEQNKAARPVRFPKAPVAKPKGGHDTNIRKSTKDKHETADARRKKEQEKAAEKAENNKKK